MIKGLKPYLKGRAKSFQKAERRIKVELQSGKSIAIGVGSPAIGMKYDAT